MNLSYAILVLLGLAIFMQFMLWHAQSRVLRLVHEHGERLALLEKRLGLGVGAPPSAQGNPAAACPAPDPLQQAIALARAGRSAQEIATSCGISEAESELLVRMRGAPM